MSKSKIVTIMGVREALFHKHTAKSQKEKTRREMSCTMEAKFHFPDKDIIDGFNKIVSLTAEELCTMYGYDGEEGNKKRSFAANKRKLLFLMFHRVIMFNEDPDVTSPYERALECTHHPKKTENIEYLSLLYGRRYAEQLLDKKSERVKGENNPAAGHGGRFSPFSEKFVKYEDLSEEERSKRIQEINESRIKTLEENPELLTTRIEFYLAQGMTEEEAQNALSERQSTFSLEKCVDALGEEKGRERWEKRQDQWLQTLSELPPEKQYEILRKKARGGWISSVKGQNNAYVYLMSTSDDTRHKFGITTNITRRVPQISHEDGLAYRLVATLSFPVDVVIDIEDKLSEEFVELSDFYRTIDEGKTPDIVSTEYITGDKDDITRRWMNVVKEFL